MIFDDLLVATHEPWFSTECANRKHKLSFDRQVPHRQLRRMAIGERISLARRNAGWSQAKLAKEVGQAQTTISSWERGRTEPTREDVQRVADALSIDLLELELPSAANDQAKSKVRPTTVPVVGYVQAGAEAILYAEGQGPFDEVPAPHNANARTVALQSRGESLGPLLSEWLVYYDDVRSPITPDMFGRLCVLGLPDGRVVVKQLKAAGADGRYHLISQNEGPMLDQEVVWGAVVTAMTPR